MLEKISVGGFVKNVIPVCCALIYFILSAIYVADNNMSPLFYFTLLPIGMVFIWGVTMVVQGAIFQMLSVVLKEEIVEYLKDLASRKDKLFK